MKNSIACNSLDKIMHAWQTQKTGYQSDTDVYVVKQIPVK